MTPNSRSNFEKEEQSRRDHNTWYFTVLQATVFKTAWYWHKSRHKNQRNRVQSPEINPSLCHQLIFDKGDGSIKWSTNSLFNKWCWENWTATCKTMKLDHQLSPYTKINSRWIKYLSHYTIKVLEENIHRKISDMPHSNILTDTCHQARDIKERINKWDCIKIKSCCMAKENISKMKRDPTIWENICKWYIGQGLDLQNI